MKRITLALLLIGLFICGTVSAAESARLFDEANRLYEAGRYDRALELYTRLQKQLQHWRLFYNTGNAWYKKDDPVRAKINYLRAARLRPLQPSIEKNIRLVNARLKDRLPPHRPDFLERLALRLETLFPINLLSVLFLLFVGSCHATVFALVRGRRHRLVWYLFIAFLCLSLLTGAYHLYRTDKISTRDLAVVVAEIDLRSGPGEGNTVLFKVHPGLEVRIVERSQGWAQVMASSQIAGWMRLDDLEVI